MAKSLPRGFIFANRKNIDAVLDKELNSVNRDKGIPRVNNTNTNTNTDIKCKTTTKPFAKFNDNDDGVPDLEDIVCTVNNNKDDDNDDDHMSGVQP